MSQKLQYIVVVERGATSFGSYVPDLPGCVAVGEAKEEVLALIKEAIELHLEALRQQGLPIPEPCSSGELVEVLAA
jgi:predicted RNase H-like HicB family nuclease